MTEKRHQWTVGIGIGLIALAIVGFSALRPGAAQAQGYPIADAVANKIIQKYTSSSCEQLWVKKEQHAPPTMEEQRAITMLHNDPQMRAEFINKVAAPIANKMFD